MQDDDTPETGHVQRLPMQPAAYQRHASSVEGTLPGNPLLQVDTVFGLQFRTGG